MLSRTVCERVLGTDSLARVFNDKQMMLLRQRHNRIHIRALTEQVHRYNSLGLGGNRFADAFDRDIHRLPVDIHYNRRQSQQRHYFRRSDERKRRRNNFVARLKPQCHERDLQGVCTVSDTDHMLRTDILGQVRLKLSHFRAFDERGRGDNLLYAAVYV